MKKLFLLSLVLLGACAKKDVMPAYQDFTPISGQFNLVDDGFLRYNHHDTTAVLSDLKLRIVTGGTKDVYEFQGKRSKHEVDNIQITVDKNRAGTGPWTGLAVTTSYYVDGKLAGAGGSSNSGKLSASGDRFTASYSTSSVQGTLK
jgi:major membrane immunogen (membrane-anchored lipoprotein)